MSRFLRSALTTAFALSCVPLMSSSTLLRGETPNRKFVFTYQVTLDALPAKAHRVRVWIPVATSDAHQRVILKHVAAPAKGRMTRDPQYGNTIYYVDIENPGSRTLTWALEYEITRDEYSQGPFETLVRSDRPATRPPLALARFLAPDRLVPIDGKMKELAEENTRGKDGTVEKARALYDFVFHTLRYDKSGTGWGRGDALWACDAKHGNCTDFHSLFISLARAEQIPAKFEIGFPLPTHSHQGDVSGYHCWAEFYVDGLGWVPVDISEAWKDPSKHDYFFGTLDANRVQFSVGRDLTLAPRQDGAPVNYFVYPYVEVDGRPYEAMEKHFAFRDLAPARLAEVPAFRVTEGFHPAP